MAWVSVKDRLPEQQMDVLVHSRWGKEVAFFRIFEDRFEVLDHHLYDIQDVTHWIPLPEPPKE